ncbi:ribonuclease R [Candidatus Mycoplasma haematohominis]|uniref:exoribonuclease II n=1 Tax=Candidatus Mycoplasma haematohominis TaxID=1494318 RepID=A0A478FQF0_9MOLU|nr:ribonuclease R [Candidatus Mycoplasma haemohominis]
MKNPKNPRSAQRLASDQRLVGAFKSQDNYGFIEGTDLYVRWDNINTALNKDIVEYVVLENIDNPEDCKTRFEAKITKIIERAKIYFVGSLIYQEEDKAFILLDNQRLNRVVTIPKNEHSIGSKLKIKLTNFQLDNLEGEIVQKIGSQEDPGIDITSVLEDYGVSQKFSEKTEQETKNIQLDIEGHRKDPERQDFTHIPFVTIDPKNSKDFDDAIAVLKEGQNYRLYVAIADVWSYIKNSPSLIEEASHRATSIYFLDEVVPMLPEKLCNCFCSLVPHEERCAIVVEILINAKGEWSWKDTKVTPGIIKSHKRFTYEEVNNFFEEKTDLSNEKPIIRESLRNGLALYREIEKARISKGYVSIESTDLKIQLNDDKKIISINKYVRREAQIMIENFMILTNENIARICEDKKIPAVYRIHERPEPSKVINFIQEVEKLGFKIQQLPSEGITQKAIHRWFEDNKNHPLLEIISTLLLRSLQKAKYSITNLGHFGLNLQHYLHFTSPIRRYPDTLVHRMLWKYLFEKNPVPKNSSDPVYKELDEMSKHCTAKEIEATEIGRTIENNKIMQFLNQKLEQVFKAKVISPAKAGGFVRLDDLNVEGFVKYKESLKLGGALLVRPIYNSKEFKLVKIL